MEQRLVRYLGALDEAMKRSEAITRQMEAERRQDEANLEKIRRNVYGIFVSLAGADAAAARRSDDPAAAFERLHQERLSCFPEPWRQRLEKAAAHGDVITQTIEETKLDTVARIRMMFAETEATL